MALKAAAAASGASPAAPPVERAVERRPSFVPKVRTVPRFGGPMFLADDPSWEAGPACDRSLNAPAGNPRFHRSAVWW
jgi:hypothetical protein